jgi:regulatory protein
MKVTNITAQQKNPDRVNIFIDGEYKLSLTLSQILEYQVKQGKEIDDSNLKLLQKASDEGKLKARTLEWLLSRPRSSKELRDYLYKKGLDKEQIDSICKYFADKNYQNDEVFAKWWIDQRLAKNKSDLSIKSELKQKGIDEEIIVNNLQHVLDNKQRLKNLIDSKNLLNKYQDRQKLMQYLASKGFSYSDIVEVLADLNTGGDNF